MLKVLAAFALVFSPVAMAAGGADELDNERTVVVPLEQKRLAAHLPQTVVIREDKKNPGNVEVAHVKDHLPAGKKVDNVTFEKMALNAEVRGLAYDSGNELDVTSSTNSWGFGLSWTRPYGYGYGYGYGRSYYAPTYRSYARPYARSYYADPYYYGRPAYRSAYYSPYYNYAGYTYSYAPYYTYSDPYYTYTYCNWPSLYY